MKRTEAHYRVLLRSRSFVASACVCFMLTFPFGVDGGLRDTVGKVYEMLECTFSSECCKEPYVRSGNQAIKELQKTLNSKFVGQHLAVEMVITALHGHLSDDNPKKPLVMSFHGWAGSGKTYLAEMIVDALYEKGTESNYVRMYTASYHFPDKDKVSEYKEKLKKEIKATLMACERAVIVFDEVDITPPALYDGIVGLLDHFPFENEVNHRKAIYIFLSNIGSNAITHVAMEAWKAGKNREDLLLHDFHETVSMESFNAQNTGFSKTRMIERVLVDFFIPFLPLEEKHVIECAKMEINRQDPHGTNSVDPRSITQKMIFWPSDVKLYSQTGCKRVDSLVKYQISAARLKNEL